MATTTARPVVAASAPVQQAHAAVAMKPVTSSVLHAPVAEADRFDMLWDELEAEAARRATGVMRQDGAAQQVGARSVLSAPLQLGAYLQRERDALKRVYRASFIWMGIRAALLLVFLFTGLFFSGMTVGIALLINSSLSDLREHRKSLKRLDEWQKRDDWRVSVGRDGLTFLTPWTNEGKEETVPWNLIHDIKAVTPPVRGAKDRFFCVERRDGLGFDGKPVTPPVETAQTGAEKRRRVWRRFFLLESREPKLPPPVLIPEIALPMSADALVARIATYEAGQAEPALANVSSG